MTTCLCNGKGAYSMTEADALGTSHITTLCACRTDLPRREGRAQWWTTEPVFLAEVDIPVGQETATVRVRAEVPISADNYPLIRRGNRYYPTLIDLELSGTDLTLHPETARALAARLIEAASAADAIDLVDVDDCGHWAPCPCEVAGGDRPEGTGT